MFLIALLDHVALIKGFRDSTSARPELPPDGLVVREPVRLTEFVVTRCPTHPIVEFSDRLKNLLLFPFG